MKQELTSEEKSHESKMDSEIKRFTIVVLSVTFAVAIIAIIYNYYF